MPDSTFTFRVDTALKDAFAGVAADQDRTVAQLLRVLMRQAVEHHEDRLQHDDWFRQQVVDAMAEAEDAAVIRVGNDAVRSSWRHQRAELERRGAGRTA